MERGWKLEDRVVSGILRHYRLRQLRRRLPLPELLVQLIRNGRWKHPGDEVMRDKIPFITDPLVFLGSHKSMLCGPLMGPGETDCEMFSEYRGSVFPERDLPWIDVEKTLIIICNRIPGDDVGIALDYRTGLCSPRIVGGDWHSGRNLIYREISPTFEGFVELLEL